MNSTCPKIRVLIIYYVILIATNWSLALFTAYQFITAQIIDRC